jgi:hypothetical protein
MAPGHVVQTSQVKSRVSETSMDRNRKKKKSQKYCQLQAGSKSLSLSLSLSLVTQAALKLTIHLVSISEAVVLSMLLWGKTVPLY